MEHRIGGRCGPKKTCRLRTELPQIGAVSVPRGRLSWAVRVGVHIVEGIPESSTLTSCPVRSSQYY